MKYRKYIRQIHKFYLFKEAIELSQKIKFSICLQKLKKPGFLPRVFQLSCFLAAKPDFCIQDDVTEPKNSYFLENL